MNTYSKSAFKKLNLVQEYPKKGERISVLLWTFHDLFTQANKRILAPHWTGDLFKPGHEIPAWLSTLSSTLSVYVYAKRGS